MKTKKFLIAFLFIGLFAYPITANNVPFEAVPDLTLIDNNYTDFDDGWKDGFCEGWKDVKGKNAFCPFAPFPPFPTWPESSDSFRDGYNRGFKFGMCEANGRSSCTK